MEGSPPRRRRELLAKMRQELFDQGYVADDLFTELENVQDSEICNFAENVFGKFYNESRSLLLIIEAKLMVTPLPDFRELNLWLDNFKVCCSSIGANRLEMKCRQMIDACNPENIEWLKGSLEQLQRDRHTMEQKLDHYFLIKRRLPGPPPGSGCASSSSSPN